MILLKHRVLGAEVMGQAGSLIVRAVVLSLLWLVLTEGAIASWLIGLPFVLGAAWASRSLRFLPPWRVSIPGAWRFFAFFVIESLRAGIDVARRAIRPGRLDLAPSMIEFPTQLPPGAGRILLLHAISILPGTLSVAWDGDVLLIHVLDVHGPVGEGLDRLEGHVRRVVRQGAEPAGMNEDA